MLALCHEGTISRSESLSLPKKNVSGPAEVDTRKQTYLLRTQGPILVAVDSIGRDKRMETKRRLAVFWDHGLAVLRRASCQREVCS